MRIISKYRILFFLFVVAFSSCKNDEVQPATNINKYSGEHTLSVDDILISGSSSIKVKITFNLTYDPTMNEVGIILLNNSKTILEKKVFDLTTLKSKETIYFDSLSSGIYSVKSYLLYNNRCDTVFSNTKIITIKNIDFTDYAITCYPTYETTDGKAVYSKNTGEFVVIYLHTDRDLPIEEIKIKLDNGLIINPSSITRESWSDLKKYEYYIQLSITDTIPSGLYNIELLENDITYPTGVQLDKLSGSWERVNSLFPGEMKGGKRIYFQSGKYAYIGFSDDYVTRCSTIDLWQFNMENYQWKQMVSLDVSPGSINVKYNSIVIGNIAFTLINTYAGKSFELWGYDISTNTWSLVSISPEVTKTWPGAMIFYLRNKLYIVGNQINNTNSGNTILSYDVFNKKWQDEKSFLPFYFDSFSSIYSIFSSTTSIYFYLTVNSKNEFWRFNILENTWIKLSAPTYPLIGPGGIVHSFNNLFYYFSGEINSYTYSEETSTWKQIANIPSQMLGGTAFDYNNQLFVGMGYNYLYNSYASSVSLYSFK